MGGIRILCIDTSQEQQHRPGELDAESVSMEELLTRADIVTVHVPEHPPLLDRDSAAQQRL